MSIILNADKGKITVKHNVTLRDLKAIIAADMGEDPENVSVKYVLSAAGDVVTNIEVTVDCSRKRHPVRD